MTKQKNTPRTDLEWIAKTIKKSDLKNRKKLTVTNQIEIAAFEQKSEGEFFEKLSRNKTTRFFAPLPVSAWPKELLQFDFKNHENVWTHVEKDSAPIQILWIVKTNILQNK